MADTRQLAQGAPSSMQKNVNADVVVIVLSQRHSIIFYLERDRALNRLHSN